MVNTLGWKLELKGADQVKTEIGDLVSEFNQLSNAGKNTDKVQRQLSSSVALRLRQDRLQNNLLLVQHPNLLRLSRAMSTINSISRTALTIANALNLSKISGKLVDEEGIKITNDLNAAYRERQELLDAGLEGSKEWIENEEEIKLLLAQQKKHIDEINNSDFESFLTTLAGLTTGIASVFNLLVKNNTILNALTKAGSLFGGVFSGFFTLVSSGVIKAGNFILAALGPKSGLDAKTALAGSRLGTIFGLSFAGAISVAIIAVGAAILAGAIDIMMENVSGQSFVRDLTEKLLGKGKGMSIKDILGLNVHKGADISGQGIFGGPNSYQEYTKGWEGATGAKDEDIENEVTIFQPLIDLFTKTIPESLVKTKDSFFTFWNGMIGITNQAISGIITGINDVFKQLVTQLNNAISQYNEKAKKIGKPTVGRMTFTPSTVGQIPMIKAATGFNGMVNSPTMFLAGEAGREQVTITPNGQSSGGNTIIVNVHGSIITEKQLAYKIDQIQKNSLKSRGFTGF